MITVMEEKKESGIMKLLNLLNDYEDVRTWYATLTTRGEKSERELKSDYMYDESQEYIQIYIISKSFGFIKWLVENDKIGVHKLAKAELENGWSIENQFLDEDDRKIYYTYNTLMLLAIQDEPIDFLISILK